MKESVWEERRLAVTEHLLYIRHDLSHFSMFYVLF